MTELKSAWAFGPYHRGQGKPGDHYRLKYACLAIKKELAWLGYSHMWLGSSIFGRGTDGNIREFQRSNGLVVDGLAGPKTCNALWRARIALHGIPGDWLRAQVHWESGDDPGAEFVNSDGSADRGLCQVNSTRKPLSIDEAFSPAFAIGFLADYQRDGAALYANCAYPDEWRLAVGRWRSPVGADDWCLHPGTSANKDGTWAEKAAYYVSRVDVDGRANWIG